MEKLIALSFVIFLARIHYVHSVHTVTTIGRRDLVEPQPLILKTGNHAWNDWYHWPTNRYGDIQFTDGVPFIVACPGTTLQVGGTNFKDESTAVVSHSGRFAILGKTVPFSAIRCTQNVVRTTRLSTNTCLGRYQEVESGFILANEQKFVKQITYCVDRSRDTTLYSISMMSKHIVAYQAAPRISFEQGNIFSTPNINGLYTPGSQLRTINEQILGIPSAQKNYIGRQENYYLNRGHLQAKNQFIYRHQQDLTFHTVNIVPQFTTFNEGNWEVLESEVVSYVRNKQIDVAIITGTYDIATITAGPRLRDFKLFLSVTRYEKKIPVPKYLWKVVYDPKTRAGIAFIGVNSPFVTSYEHYRLCPDITASVPWVQNIRWNVRDAVAGYMYVCDVNRFRSKVDTFPGSFIPVNSVLV